MKKAQKVRKSGLTFAPEAGTQRLRDVINKGISEEDIVKSAELAFNGGWSSIKLYFMIGLPTETTEDIEGILVLKIDYYMNMKNSARRGETDGGACFAPSLLPVNGSGRILKTPIEKQNLLRKDFGKYRNQLFSIGTMPD